MLAPDRAVACLVATLLLACAGCATSAEDMHEAQAAERQIDTILSEPGEAADYAAPKRCLAESEYRSFRPLDDRRILFEGTRGRLWLNTLLAPCPDLRYATALRVKSIYSFGRICDMDTFRPADWFDWPWYRRWPWSRRDHWDTGITCSLGDFQPVNEAQVAAIERALKSGR